MPESWPSRARTCHGHRALDLGCGPGRLLARLASEFEHVDGIDIAPEMIDIALASGPPPNVNLQVSSGADLDAFADESCDLVVSLLVMQHIPDTAVVVSYLSEIRRVLTANGRAFLQLDSRPPSIAERLVHALPDPLLPKIRRKYARRYRRRPSDIDGMVDAAALRKTRESGREKQNHFVVVAARPRSDWSELLEDHGTAEPRGRPSVTRHRVYS